MKTFRKFLYSYLGLFLLPVILLSFFVFQYVVRYCESEAVSRNTDSLERLEAVITENCVQMDSMATLAMRQSEFFARNLRKSSGFYQIERTLMRWAYTNTFISDVYFYNSDIDRIYTSYAVYSEEDFYGRFFSGGDLPAEELSRLFDEGPDGRWLVNVSDKRELYYISGRRVDTTQHNVFIFRIDTGMLDELIGDSILYDDCVTALCSSDGTVLYASGDHGGADISFTANGMDESRGRVAIDGEINIYTAVYSERLGAYLVEAVPEKTAFGGIYRLELIYFGILLLVTIGGSIAVIILMRLNYYPISRIENEMIASQALPSVTNDAFVNMNTALDAMRTNNERTRERISSMRKEQTVQRLMLGLYASKDEFNLDARECGLTLNGTSWRIADLRTKTARDEAGNKELIRLVRQYYGDAMYLEIPESGSFIFIIPTDRTDADKAEALKRDAESNGLAVRLSSVCTDTKKLPEAYASVLRSGVTSGERNTSLCYTKEALDSLQNAVRFSEKEHILFALANIRDILPEIMDARSLLSVTYDALTIVRACLKEAPPSVTERLDGMRTGLFEMDADAWKIAGDTVKEVYELVSEELREPDIAENDRVNEIQAYIMAHYSEPSLTVQEIAEHFGMSVSNLAHYFHKYTGYTLSDMLQSYRIEKAKRLLRETEMTVAEVGSAVGYSVQATFLRAFKKAAGQPPSAYRENRTDIER